MKEIPNIVRILGENLRNFRKSCNLTQEELSEKCNVNVITISNIERGCAWPNPETIEKIASALNIPSNELFTDYSNYFAYDYFTLVHSCNDAIKLMENIVEWSNSREYRVNNANRDGPMNDPTKDSNKDLKYGDGGN